MTRAISILQQLFIELSANRGNPERCRLLNLKPFESTDDYPLQISTVFVFIKTDDVARKMRRNAHYPLLLQDHDQP